MTFRERIIWLAQWVAAIILLGGIVAFIGSLIWGPDEPEGLPLDATPAEVREYCEQLIPAEFEDPYEVEDCVAAWYEGRPEQQQESTEQRNTALVTRVIDGDTIELKGGETVRLIGVDTPETIHPSEPVGCFGPKASRFTTTMLEGQEVRLEFDVEREDRYGRTLAYVWVDDRLFNETLVARGFAQVSTYPPNVKYVDRLIEAQRIARSAGYGLWGSCTVEPDTRATTGNTDGNGNRCDPNYSECVPVYPPDVDCDDLDMTNVHVIGSDPHGLDSAADADRVGCET